MVTNYHRLKYSVLEEVNLVSTCRQFTCTSLRRGCSHRGGNPCPLFCPSRSSAAGRWRRATLRRGPARGRSGRISSSQSVAAVTVASGPEHSPVVALSEIEQDQHMYLY